MSKSENSSRRGLPPSSRRRSSSLPRKKVSPDKDHISGENSIKSRKKGSKPSKREPDEADLGGLFAGMPGGELTLLDIPTRKPLPELPQRRGRSCLLVEIIKYNPQLYARMIALITFKSSANLAAMKVGINESTFWDWSYRGKADAERGEDTYFSRFNEDIRRAAASAAIDAEMQVNEKSPERYLQHGLGRIFGIGKQKNRRELPGGGNGQGMLPAPTQTMEDVIDGVFTVIPPRGDSEEDVRDMERGVGEDIESTPFSSTAPSRSSQPIGTTLKLSPSQEAEALGVLEGIGQVEIDRREGVIVMSDALKQAFQEQVSK